ncbi:MAG TPA: zf-HC2 domain-containing protein [Thermoanaerobaculia bacterium]|nr:zf-HC2 domain-containing protein [Thermoanaerobaculia bacterium]
MDHRRIEEQNVAELYVTGRLSPEDEETFESHLLECSECRESVGWADDLRTSIRAVAAEDAARASVQLGFLAWVSRRTRTARAGLLMAALLAVAALPVWLQADRSRLARELTEARSEAQTATDRPTAPAPAPAAPQTVPAAPDISALEKLAEENRLLAEQLRESREQLAQVDEPQINTPIVSLGVVRGESDATVELGPSPEPILLSLELPQVEYDTYRVTLLDNRNKTVWQKDGLEPTASETLTILFPSERLKAGTSYRFRLEGMEPGGRAVDIGDIPFRAVKG